MFGSYRINERKDAPPRLGLRLERGELNLYTCSVRFIDEPLDEIYDWSADVMSDRWDPAAARRKLRAMPGRWPATRCSTRTSSPASATSSRTRSCSGSACIRCRRSARLPPRKLAQLVDEARRYSFDFLEWKKAFVLRKHWLAHTKRTCPRRAIPFVKAHLGRTPAAQLLLRALPAALPGVT